MPVSPIQLYMLQVVGEIENQVTINRFWFKGHTASPASTILIEMSNIHSHFKSTVLPKFQAYCSSRWHGNHLMILNMSTRPRQMVDEVINVAGLQDAMSLPSYSAGLLSLRSGFADRTRNGRIYLPPTDAGNNDGSRHSGAAFGLLQAFGAQLLTSFGPAGVNTYGRIGIFSPKLGRTQPGGAGTQMNYSVAGWTACTEIIPRSLIATQRKRYVGKGL